MSSGLDISHCREELARLSFALLVKHILFLSPGGENGGQMSRGRAEKATEGVRAMDSEIM